MKDSQIIKSLQEYKQNWWILVTQNQHYVNAVVGKQGLRGKKYNYIG